MFWLLTPVGCIICKYFLPFSWLCFCFINGFLCYAKDFKFNYVPFCFVLFCFFAFVSFALGDRLRKNIALIYVKECSAYVFL